MPNTTRTEFEALRAEIAGLRAAIHQEATRRIKWMSGLFIPVWVATWAMVAAVIFKF